MWKRIVMFAETCRDKIAPLGPAGRWLAMMVQLFLDVFDAVVTNATRVLMTWLIGLLFMLGGAAYLVAFFEKADMNQPEIQVYAAVAIAVAALAQAIVLWCFEVCVGSFLGDPDEFLVEKGADALSDRLNAWFNIAAPETSSDVSD